MTIISTTKKNMHPNRIVMIRILFIPLREAALYIGSDQNHIFKRPGVAWAVLQTPL